MEPPHTFGRQKSNSPERVYSEQQKHSEWIETFNTYLFSADYVLGTVLHAAGNAVNKTGKNHTHTHTHTQEYNSAMRKKEILPCATTGMDIEGIILSKISQIEKYRYCMILDMCNLKSQTQKPRLERLACWGVGQKGRFLVEGSTTSSYKMNKFWTSHVQRGEYS